MVDFTALIMYSNEFSVIKSGRKSRRNKYVVLEKTVDDWVSEVRTKSEQVEGSQFYKELVSRLDGLVKDSQKDQDSDKLPAPKVCRVRCLALGSPCESVNALYQLAILELLRVRLGVCAESVSVWDPVFTPDDVQLFGRLGYLVAEHDLKDEKEFEDKESKDEKESGGEQESKDDIQSAGETASKGEKASTGEKASHDEHALTGEKTFKDETASSGEEASVKDENKSTDQQELVNQEPFDKDTDNHLVLYYMMHSPPSLTEHILQTNQHSNFLVIGNNLTTYSNHLSTNDLRQKYPCIAAAIEDIDGPLVSSVVLSNRTPKKKPQVLPTKLNQTWDFFAIPEALSKADAWMTAVNDTAIYWPKRVVET